MAKNAENGTNLYGLFVYVLMAGIKIASNNIPKIKIWIEFAFANPFLALTNTPNTTGSKNSTIVMSYRNWVERIASEDKKSRESKP